MRAYWAREPGFAPPAPTAATPASGGVRQRATRRARSLRHSSGARLDQCRSARLFAFDPLAQHSAHLAVPERGRDNGPRFGATRRDSALCFPRFLVLGRGGARPIPGDEPFPSPIPAVIARRSCRDGAFGRRPLSVSRPTPGGIREQPAGAPQAETDCARSIVLRRVARGAICPSRRWNGASSPIGRPSIAVSSRSASSTMSRHCWTMSRCVAASCSSPPSWASFAQSSNRASRLGETDDMALSGIISTQLLYDQFVHGFRKADPAVLGAGGRIVRRSLHR